MLLRFLAPSLLAAPVLAQASFQPLNLPFSRASGISAAGGYVVGSAPGITFRWNTATGMQSVTSLAPEVPGEIECSLGAFLGCGTYLNPSSGASEASRWDSAGTLLFLGSLPGNLGSTAYGIDDAGATIVGSANNVSAFGTTWHAFRWTQASGLVDLGTSAGNFSRANGVSGDGSVAVGWCNGVPRQPARWIGTTFAPLGNGTTAGEAWAASADGSVITGVYGNELFRWTQAAGMQLLGKLPGSTASDVATGLDISAYGDVIVGSQTSLSSPPRAFLWRASTGLVDLASYLSGLGVTQVAGWSLRSAVGVSVDGTRIAGWGVNPANQTDSWFATIPPEDPLSTFCTPGLAGASTCPCANPPAGSGRGCDNSAGTGGARIAGSGSASLANDTSVIAITGLLPTSTTVLLQGTSASSGIAFGQGVLCIGGSLKRLYLRGAVAGSLSLPQAGDLSISARSAQLGDTLSAGSTRQYQAWYRDPVVLGGCAASATWNTSDAGTLAWNP